MVAKIDNLVATSQHRKDVDLRKFIHRQLMGLKPSQPLPSVREIMRDCNVSFQLQRDQVAMTVVPEPAALSMLTLGILGFARRRK